VAETRALIPRDTSAPAPIPTDVDPPTPPAVDVTDVDTVPPGAGAFAPPRPQPWAGWPLEWATPNWGGHAEELVDIAWACLDLNSSVAASMPPYLVDAAPSLDAGWLINPDPDRYESWEEFFRQVWWDYQAAGEAIIVATARYVTGWPSRFHVVPPWLVDVELDDAGVRQYRIGDRDVPRADICHIRYQSSTQDARGRSALAVGRGRMVAARLLGAYLTNLMAAGGAPTTVLVHPQEVTAEQAAALQAQWIEARMNSMGLPAVLSGGLDFRSTGLSPKDLALTELAGMTEARIAVLLRVPPYLVGLPQSSDSLVYNTAGLTLDYHWRAHLRPLVRPIVAALSKFALPAGTMLEVNRDAYVQPGPYERAQTWQILTSIGVLTAEQVAEIERYVYRGQAATLTAGETP
jgi:HK97 family phage portal protein